MPKRRKTKRSRSGTGSKESYQAKYVVKLAWFVAKSFLLIVPISVVIVFVMWLIVELFNPPAVVLNITPIENGQVGWNQSGSYFATNDNFKNRRIKSRSLTAGRNQDSMTFKLASGKSNQKWFGGPDKRASIICLQLLGRCQADDDAFEPQVLVPGNENPSEWVGFESYLQDLLATVLESSGSEGRRKQLFVFCDIDEMESISSIQNLDKNFSFAVQEMWKSQKEELCKDFDLFLILSHGAGQKSLLTLRSPEEGIASERISFFLYRLEEAILGAADGQTAEGAGKQDKKISYGEIKSYLQKLVPTDADNLNSVQVPVFLESPQADGADQINVCRRPDGKKQKLFLSKRLDKNLGNRINERWETILDPTRARWLLFNHPDWHQEAIHLLVRLEQLWLQCHNQSAIEVKYCLNEFDKLASMIAAQRKELQEYVFADEAVETKSTSFHDDPSLANSGSLDLSLFASPLVLKVPAAKPPADDSKTDGKDAADGKSKQDPAAGTQPDEKKPTPQEVAETEFKEKKLRFQTELEKFQANERASGSRVWNALNDTNNTGYLTKHCFDTLINRLKLLSNARYAENTLPWSEIAYLQRVQQEWNWDHLADAGQRPFAQQSLQLSLQCRDLSNQLCANLHPNLLEIFQQEIAILERQRRRLEDELFSRLDDFRSLALDFENLRKSYDELNSQHQDFVQQIEEQRKWLLLAPHYLRYVAENAARIRTGNEIPSAADPKNEVIAEDMSVSKLIDSQFKDLVSNYCARWQALAVRPPGSLENANESLKTIKRLNEDFAAARSAINEMLENAIGSSTTPDIDISVLPNSDKPQYTVAELMVSKNLLQWPDLKHDQVKKARNHFLFGQLPLEIDAEILEQTGAISNSESQPDGKSRSPFHDPILLDPETKNIFAKRVTNQDWSSKNALFEKIAAFHANPLDQDGVKIVRLQDGKDELIQISKDRHDRFDEFRIDRLLRDFWATPNVEDGYYFVAAANRLIGKTSKRNGDDIAELKSKIDGVRDYANQYRDADVYKIAKNWKWITKGDDEDNRQTILETDRKKLTENLPPPLSEELSLEDTLARVTISGASAEQRAERIPWQSWRFGSLSLESRRIEEKRRKVEIFFRGHVALCELEGLPKPPVDVVTPPPVRRIGQIDFVYERPANSKLEIARQNPPERYRIIVVLDCSTSMDDFVVRRSNEEDAANATQRGRKKLSIMKTETNAFLERLAGQRSARVDLIAFGASREYQYQEDKIHINFEFEPNALKYRHWYEPVSGNSSAASKPETNYIRLKSNQNTAPKILRVSNVENLTKPIKELSAHGQTPLFYSIQQALKLFPDKDSSNQEIQNILVVISDGFDYTYSEKFLTDGLQPSVRNPESALGKIFQAKNVELRYFNFGSREDYEKELRVEDKQKKQKLELLGKMEELAKSFGSSSSGNLKTTSLNQFLSQIAPDTSVGFQNKAGTTSTLEKDFDSYLDDVVPIVDLTITGDNDFRSANKLRVKRGGKTIAESTDLLITRGMNLSFVFDEEESHNNRFGTTNLLKPRFGKIPWNDETRYTWTTRDGKDVFVRLREENGIGNFYVDLWGDQKVTPAPAALFLRVHRGDQSFLLQDYQARHPAYLNSYNVVSYNVARMGSSLPIDRLAWKGPIDVDLHLVPHLAAEDYQSVSGSSTEPVHTEFEIGKLDVKKSLDSTGGSDQLKISFQVSAKEDPATDLDQLIIQPYFRPKDDQGVPGHELLHRFKTAVQRKYRFVDGKLNRIDHIFTFSGLNNDDDNELANLRFMILSLEEFNGLAGAKTIRFRNNTDWERASSR